MPYECIVTLPKMYICTCGCKKNALKDLSAASLGLYAHNFANAKEKNAVPMFTKRLTWTLHKLCK